MDHVRNSALAALEGGVAGNKSVAGAGAAPGGAQAPREERVLLREETRGVVACEGAKLVERHERARHWAAWMEADDMEQVGLSYSGAMHGGEEAATELQVGGAVRPWLLILLAHEAALRRLRVAAGAVAPPPRSVIDA
uniref:Uncharacterized protein n=1 Tax=Oryza glumipatula TaxID=40148 RepID=A0A0E0A9P9_9ORYZ